MKPRLLLIVGMILAAIASRLVPHPPNFTPIGAIALLGGACVANKPLAFVIPLAAMFLSDLVLGLGPQTVWVYASFAATVCIGLWIRSRRTPLTIAGGALAGAVLFFVVTNFGVWAAGTLYPKTTAGLAECYGAAIPFFRNMLLADLFHAALLFGCVALAEKRFPRLREPELVAAQ